MRGLIWSTPARADIDRIEAWLDENRQPEYALRVVRAIYAKASMLSDFPGASSRLKDDRRKAVIPGTPHLIVYRDQGDCIEILRLFHERQDWKSAIS